MTTYLCLPRYVAATADYKYIFHPCDVKFEVLMAVRMTVLFFWVVTPCGLINRYRRFGGTYCLHLQG
jgi:hypothetical protein